MTGQELIEQNVRMLIGDLQLQLIIARARIAELESQLDPGRANGAQPLTKEELYGEDHRPQ